MATNPYMGMSTMQSFRPDGSKVGGPQPDSFSGGSATFNEHPQPFHGGSPYQERPGPITQTQNLGMGGSSPNGQMQTDWNNYWSSAKQGDKTNWGGGTLQNLGNGQSWYSSPNAMNGGQMLTKDTNMDQLASMNQGVAQQWDKQYGYKPQNGYFFDGKNVASGDLYNHQAGNQYGIGANGKPVSSSIPVLDGNDSAHNMELLKQAGFINAAGDGPGALMTKQATTYGQPSPSSNFGVGGGQPMGAQNGPAMGGQGGQYGMNPYIQQQAQNLTAMSNQNLKQNVLPGIGQGAQAAGMYGSSRQGTAEGLAMGNAQTGLNSAIGNLYSNAYGQDQNYALGNKQADNSYNLGMGNLALGNRQAGQSYDLGLRSNDLGFGQLDANINQQNFNNNMAGANFGLGIYDRMNGYNQQGTGIGTQLQNQPLNYFNQFNSNTNNAGGLGGSSSGTQGTSSNGALNGLGIGQLLGTGITNWLSGP